MVSSLNNSAHLTIGPVLLSLGFINGRRHNPVSVAMNNIKNQL